MLRDMWSEQPAPDRKERRRCSGICGVSLMHTLTCAVTLPSLRTKSSHQNC